MIEETRLILAATLLFFLHSIFFFRNAKLVSKSALSKRKFSRSFVDWLCSPKVSSILGSYFSVINGGFGFSHIMDSHRLLLSAPFLKMDSQGAFPGCNPNRDRP